jgi:hypothetical protein
VKVAPGQSALPGVLDRPRQPPPRRRSYPIGPTGTPVNPVLTALDLSYTSSGVAWLEATGHVGVRSIRTTGVDFTDPDGPAGLGLRWPARRQAIVGALFEHVGPSTLLVREGRIESLSVKGASLLDLAALHASVEDECWRRGVPLATVNLQRVKIYAAGTGRADKDAMVEAAQREFAGLVAVANDDEADALWVLAIAAHIAGLPMVRVNARRLTVVAQCRAGGPYGTWPSLQQGAVMPARIMSRIRSGHR